MFNTGLTATYVDFGGYLFNGSGVIIYVPIGLSYYGLKGILNRCWPRNKYGS
jgi:hypothetical protein